mgnify:FL=1
MNASLLDKLNIFANPFKMFFPKKMVGIDIGTTAVKVVEISRWGQGKTLENYGEIKSTSLYKDSFRTVEKGNFLLSEHFISKAVRAVLDESRIKTKEAIFSVPDFSTFCVSFDLPPMTAKEVPQAVYYHAPQYIPLPITETTLDWRIISGEPGESQSMLKVFLVAVPNQIVQEYQRVAEKSGLELYAIEAEALSITRAFAKDKKKIICLIDIGAQSTTINVIDRGNLKKSYSFDFAGGQLTYAVSSILGLSNIEAEEIKNKQGLISGESIAKTLYLLIDPLVFEVKKLLLEFFEREQKEIDEIYLTGGSSNLPGLKEYFAESLKKEVKIPNCFSDFLYPPILEKDLRKMSPSFSVAVGAALGGLET